ncbi:MAG: fibronectin type III domain-containing protein [Flavobacteriaceae bacterium]|jgi:hypothetical protein|nr:fibronectin type III domain-containing protein [Flavobacteriaceae bacterium]
MRKKLLFFVAASLSICLQMNAQNEQDYTVPSWTLYQRTVVAGSPDPAVLVSKYHPYNVNVTLNGDPTAQMGVAWFTNTGVTGTKLQWIEGTATNASSFTGANEITATSTPFDDVNYVSARENNNNNQDLINKTGFSIGEKRSYISNKALISGLMPNTTYSYRVGGVNGAWSEIGTFTTAKANKDEFEFIYVTDTQANTDEMFDISAKTIDRAFKDVPNAKFLLIAGDLVESSGSNSSEWEWEQWFEKMQSQWYHLPIAPVQGNHDTSPFSNWSYHFNTDTSYNASQPSSNPNAKTAMDGTVYSFVYGDALFMIFNYEDYAKGETYFSALETWMENQVAAHPEVKWRIAVYHKTMFTGSGSHQNDSDGKTVRERFAKVLQRLGVNFALQGHDHIYEVIGVVATDETTFTRLPSAVTGQTYSASVGTREDMTGIHGGTFNTTNGVLYFLNNSAGKKKYEPRTETQMNNAIGSHGIQNYYTLFNRFGQTGEPTFSRVQVSSDAIRVSTYTVNEAGESSLFDAFEIVEDNLGINETPNPDDMLIIYHHDQQIVLESKKSTILSVGVYDFSGISLYQNNHVNSNSIRIPSAQFGRQVLIVKVKTEKGEVITKKVLNK